jgi:hypothetical protein
MHQNRRDTGRYTWSVVMEAEFLQAAETTMNERHRAQSSPRQTPFRQLPLALESAASGTEAGLRAAYRRLAISRSLSYEQAMSLRPYEIGIRNLAEATARRIERRRRHRGNQR